MRSTLLSSILLLCVFPAYTKGFVITSLQKTPCLYTKTTKTTGTKTTIWEELKNDNYDNVDLLNATSSTASTFSTNNDGVDEEDVVSKNTNRILESMSPKDMVVDTEEQKEDEDDFQDQIFNPMSFWTERTGRFPRNQ